MDVRLPRLWVVLGTDASALCEMSMGEAWRPTGHTWVESLSGTRVDVPWLLSYAYVVPLLDEVVLVMLAVAWARVDYGSAVDDPPF